MKLTRTNILFLIAVAILAFVCVDSCNGQTVISDFSGGMNTWDSWPADNEFYQCRNVFLDDPRGAATVRHGFHSITSAMADHTRHRSIYGAKYPTGESYLFRVVQRDTITNVCDLYISGESDYDLDTKLYEWLHPSAGKWVTWLSNQYYFNGRQAPIVVIDGTQDVSVIPMTPPTPGQAITVPINKAGGALDGEYIYAILGRVPCRGDDYGVPDPGEDSLYSKRPGSWSVPVTANLEYMRITGFQPIIKDSVCNAPGPTDSTQYLILRTRQNKNSLYDSVWVIDTIETVNDETDTLVYYDNASDFFLFQLDYWGTVAQLYSTGLTTAGEVDWAWSSPFNVPSDSLNVAYALGSMSLIAIVDSFAPADTVIGYDFGSGFDKHVQNWYTYTLLDKETGVESDTARSLVVERPGSGNIFSSVTLGIPAPPDDRYHRIIYRMHMYIDSLRAYKFSPEFSGINIDQAYFALDTIYSGGFIEYLDTLSPGFIEVFNDVYERAVPNGHYKGGLVHEGRLYVWDDYRLYYSATDTARFPAFQNVAFDLDDGTKILSVVAYEGSLVIYKEGSIWVLFTSDGSVYDRQKASIGIGAIASHSVARYKGSNIFLGKLGVTFEADGKFRDRRYDREFASDPIRNLIIRDIETMQTAVGQVLGDRYYLTYPGTDSTYLFHFKTGGWSVLTFDYSEATLYDTTSGTNFNNLSEWYFTKDDSELLYVWDIADTTDDGSDYEGMIEKRQLSRSSWSEQILNQIVVQVDDQTNMSSDTDSLSVSATTETGDTLMTTVVDSLSLLYRRVPMVSAFNRVFHHLNFKIEMPNRSNLTIKAIELEISPAGIR